MLVHTRRIRRIGNAWEVNAKGCAASRFALREDVASALLDDSVDRRKPQAGAFAFFLGGEEWFENARLGFSVHACAGIGNRKQDVGAGLNQRMFAARGIRVCFAGLNQNSAAIGHRVFGIDDQVHDHLFQLAGIRARMSHVRSQLGGEVNVFADQRTQQSLHICNDGIHVHHFEFQQLLPAEGEQLPGERGCPIRGLLNGLNLDQQRIVLIQRFHQNFGVPADHHQEVVEVVGHATSETADSLHFLRLPELIFQRAPLSYIFGNDFERLVGFIEFGCRSSAESYGNDAAVLPFPTDFRTVETSGSLKFLK